MIKNTNSKPISFLYLFVTLVGLATLPACDQSPRSAGGELPTAPGTDSPAPRPVVDETKKAKIRQAFSDAEDKLKLQGVFFKVDIEGNKVTARMIGYTDQNLLEGKFDAKARNDLMRTYFKRGLELFESEKVDDYSEWNIGFRLKTRLVQDQLLKEAVSFVSPFRNSIDRYGPLSTEFNVLDVIFFMDELRSQWIWNSATLKKLSADRSIVANSDFEQLVATYVTSVGTLLKESFVTKTIPGGGMADLSRLRSDIWLSDKLGSWVDSQSFSTEESVQNFVSQAARENIAALKVKLDAVESQLMAMGLKLNTGTVHSELWDPQFKNQWQLNHPFDTQPPTRVKALAQFGSKICDELVANGFLIADKSEAEISAHDTYMTKGLLYPIAFY